jgi:hypothetical protein
VLQYADLAEIAELAFGEWMVELAGGFELAVLRSKQVIDVHFAKAEIWVEKIDRGASFPARTLLGAGLLEGRVPPALQPGGGGRDTAFLPG